MPGPCSRPNGPKSDWERDNEHVCSQHSVREYGPRPAPCDVDKCEALVVTYRMWQASRGRLQTGKTHTSNGR